MAQVSGAWCAQIVYWSHQNDLKNGGELLFKVSYIIMLSFAVPWVVVNIHDVNVES